MPERTRTLPLIPLDDAVVLPNMALAVSISTAEARAAIDDALSGDAPAQVVLVTRTDGRFARIGTVAELDGHPAMLPGGIRGVTIRALHRAELGRADAAGQALRIEVVEHPDPDDPSERSQELAHEYRADPRGDPRGPRQPRRRRVPALDRRTRARWPTRPATPPTSRSSASSSCSRRSTSRSASRRRSAGPRRPSARSSCAAASATT